jgi:thermitase
LAPNDPYLGGAWHLYQIGAPSAWDITTGTGVTIAILDSGVAAGHPDLAPRLVPGWNFYDSNSNTSDVYGHGTRVAGAAAAVMNNGEGVVGVAGGALIMPIRVTDLSGNGYISMMAQGITWAADRGARVANLSFQAGGYTTIQNAAQYMKNKGGLVITAAGNYGQEETFTPSDTTVVVSATDGSDARTSWSSYGSFVDIAAPGAGIWTTDAGGGYAPASGTSFSSPITAGVVALMIGANPALGANTLQSILFSTAADLGDAGWDKLYGHGRVDAARAVQEAAASVSRDVTAPSVAISAPAGGAVVSGLVAVDVGATDDVGVTRVELLVNGSPIASDFSAPYGFSWDSAQVADGAHTLTAYAYDAAGNYSSHSVSIRVANAVDTAAPVVAISSPLAGSRVTKKTKVAAAASDDVAVAGMSLYIDGKLMTTTNTGTLSYSWNTQPAAKGIHTLRVDAIDAAGNVGSQSITVTK